MRALNDADVQGFGAISGKGVELVVTLGTGFGSALFLDGKLVPNLEVAHHPFHRGKTYEEHLGSAALKKLVEKNGNSVSCKRLPLSNTYLTTIHFTSAAAMLGGLGLTFLRMSK